MLTYTSSACNSRDALPLDVIQGRKQSLCRYQFHHLFERDAQPYEKKRLDGMFVARKQMAVLARELPSNAIRGFKTAFAGVLVYETAKFYGLVKSHDLDGFVKSSRYGLQILRNESYLRYAAMTKGEA